MPLPEKVWLPMMAAVEALRPFHRVQNEDDDIAVREKILTLEFSLDEWMALSAAVLAALPNKYPRKGIEVTKFEIDSHIKRNPKLIAYLKRS